MNRWAGRFAIVTGATVGIGAAVTERLLANGVNVIGVARSLDALIANEKNWQHLSGRYYCLKSDLSNANEFDSLVSEAEKIGPIDILINNAGMTKPTTLMDGDSSDWSYMMQVNVVAPAALTRDVLKSMQARSCHDGHIINICSISGHRVPGIGSYKYNELNSNFYAATKFAMRALSEGTRLELRAIGSHIRVTNISPGLVTTKFHKDLLTDEEKKKAFGNIEMLEPEDIADGVLYALSANKRVDVNDIIIRPTEQKM